MKRLSLIFLLFLLLFQLFADEDKQKLAVMEFEDMSHKLDQSMLDGATEYIRSAFVSSNKFVVIAKERQEKTLIKEMKKESYKSCNDKNCQIPLGQALSADTILRTTINYFGGTFTITSELIDLAKEATVSGAKQNFDGSEESLKQALDRIVVQITGTGVTYDVAAMKTQEIHGVKLGGVELDTMPKIEVKEANFSDVKSNYEVSKFEVNAGISLDADADVLVLYDKCVDADAAGEKNPMAAIRLWSELAGIREKNPFIAQAGQRAADWKKYIYSRQMSALFENAKTVDKAGQIFPLEAMKTWNDVHMEKGTDQSGKFDNPYKQTAFDRFNFWKQYNEQVKKYRDQLAKFENQRKEDREKLKKILPLKVLTDAQKRTILVQYMEIYSPFYGTEDVNGIIDSLDKAVSQHLYGLVYNDYLKKEMAEKCGKGNGSACYISASLTEVENPQKSNMFFAQSCEKGVINACVKAGKIYYDNKQFKDAAKLFYESCGMESSEGCHLAAYVTEKGEGTDEDRVLAGGIYQKACDLGYESSCKPARQLGGSTSAQAVRTESAAESAKSIGKSGKQRSNDTYHPYKKAGISLLVTGAALTIGGVAGFHIASDKEYDKYKKYTGSSMADDAKQSGWSESKYLSEAKKHRDKSNTFRYLEITCGAVGGTMFVTGIILAAIKKEKPQQVSLSTISLVPADGGFYAGIGFEF